MLNWRGAWKPFVVAAIGGPCWPLPSWARPPATIELAYDVDASLGRCPSEADVRRAIHQGLGRDPFVGPTTSQVAVELRPSTQGIEGIVVWRSAQGTSEGERRFVATGRDCVDLVHAIEFSILVQIELLGAPSEPADQRSLETDLGARDPERGAPASPRVPATPSADTANLAGVGDAASVGERAPWHFFAGLGPLVEWGTSPSVSAGGRLFAAVRREALSAELGVEASLPSSWRGDDGTGFRARALVGMVAGCGHWEALSFCGVGKWARLSVTGLGVDEAASPSGWLVRLGARIAGTHSLGRHVAGSLRAEFLAAPATWTVELNRLPIWTTPTVAGVLGFDLAATFP